MRATSPFLLTLGIRIRDARKARGFSQQELADAVELARTSIANIEAGVQELGVENFRRVCKKLGMTMDELVPVDEIEMQANMRRAVEKARARAEADLARLKRLYPDLVAEAVDDKCKACGGDGNGAVNKRPGLLNYVVCRACGGSGKESDRPTDEIGPEFKGVKL